MLIILSLLSAINREGLGAPLQPPSTSSSDTSDPSGDIHFVTNYRSTPGIIWTCFATTLLCTWVSIHPDIVGYGSKKSERFKARVKWFFVAFFAPELALAYAALQWKLANDIAHHFGKHRPCLRTKLLKSMRNSLVALLGKKTTEWVFGVEGKDDDPRHWKMEHGHFLLMGGVIFLVDGNLKYFPLPELLRNGNDNTLEKENFNELATAHRALKAQLPNKTIEIRDRSKGDAITKGLTFLQTIWFIVQIVARRVQNLDVTALEIVTLAYAVTTLLAYIFWWDKPLHVQNPIIISLDHILTAPEPKQTERSQTTFTEIPEKNVKYKLKRSWIYELAWLRPIERRKPRMLNAIVVYLVLALLGVPGSFYYIAWNFTFPRLPIGRILWRVACVVSTSLPVLAALVAITIPILGLVGLVIFGLGYLLCGCWHGPRDSKGRSMELRDDMKNWAEGSKVQEESNPKDLKAQLDQPELEELDSQSRDGAKDGEEFKAQEESNSKDPKAALDQPELEKFDSQSRDDTKDGAEESNRKGPKAQLDQSELEELDPQSRDKTEYRNRGKEALLLVVSTFYYSSRLILVALALWDLHDLPSDAHQTVSWSHFIPHF